MVTIKSNTTTNKTVGKVQKSILYLILLSSKFIEAVFVAFIGMLQLTSVDALCAASVISSHVFN